MSNKENKSKNILFVTIFIGTMLLFMLGTVIYVTGQVTNCSSVKKVRKMCDIKSMDFYKKGVRADQLPWSTKS